MLVISTPPFLKSSPKRGLWKRPVLQSTRSFPKQIKIRIPLLELRCGTPVVMRDARTVRTVRCRSRSFGLVHLPTFALANVRSLVRFLSPALTNVRLVVRLLISVVANAAFSFISV